MLPPETPIEALVFVIGTVGTGIALIWAVLAGPGWLRSRRSKRLPADTILADLEARDKWAEDTQGLGATPAAQAAIAQLRADVLQGKLKPWEYETELDAVLEGDAADQAWVDGQLEYVRNGTIRQDTGIPEYSRQIPRPRGEIRTRGASFDGRGLMAERRRWPRA